MFRLMRVPVLVVVLAVSLRLPHCSLLPATTCKLPRDLTSRVWHRELAERTEAVNTRHKDPGVAIASLFLSVCPLHMKHLNGI